MLSHSPAPRRRPISIARARLDASRTAAATHQAANIERSSGPHQSCFGHCNLVTNYNLCSSRPPESLQRRVADVTRHASGGGYKQLLSVVGPARAGSDQLLAHRTGLDSRVTDIVSFDQLLTAISASPAWRIPGRDCASGNRQMNKRTEGSRISQLPQKNESCSIALGNRQRGCGGRLFAEAASVLVDVVIIVDGVLG